MPARRRKRGSIVGEVELRLATATAMGAAMFHPAMEPGEAIGLLRKGQSAYLSAVETEAFDRLMPAPFAAAFSRGWNQARAAAAGA